MVFLNSLKDMRPTAPQKSRGSGARRLKRIAHLVPIRATQTDIVLRCQAFCLRGYRLLIISQPIADIRLQVRTSPGELSRLSAQET